MGIIIMILAVIVAPSFCQYAFQTGLRPDVRFGEDNNRFDVTNLIRRQKKHFKPNLDSQSVEEYRRRYKPKPKKKHKDNEIENDLPWPKLISSKRGRIILTNRIKAELEDHVNNLANTIIHKIRDMRRNENFAYHDNMDSAGGDGEDLYTNLRAFDNYQDSKIDGIKDEDDFAQGQSRLQGFRDFCYAPLEELNIIMWNTADGSWYTGGGIVNKLHGTKETRRTALDPEKEILFHYAFPLDMQIEGFLQAPDI